MFLVIQNLLSLLRSLFCLQNLEEKVSKVKIVIHINIAMKALFFLLENQHFLILHMCNFLFKILLQSELAIRDSSTV